MKIEQRRVTVRELVAGFSDDGEGGVVGMGGLLDIRPAYQREFVYKEAQRAAVIDTVVRGFPLNVMYFSERGDGTFEVMDGQQRTISLCQFVTNAFSRDYRYFHNLGADEQAAILDYELLVYFCSGTETETLDWFRTINIAGEKLTDQELRNAVYHGPWLADAKRWFSRTSGPAATVSDGYVAGTPNRQDLLAKALRWAVLRDELGAIEEYMAAHQHDPNATDLWSYWQQVIAWATSTFPVRRSELRSVDWGALYVRHGDTFPDGAALEQRVAQLMGDDEVTRKAGIYPFVLDGDERHLSLRAFTANIKREAYERQAGVCPACGETFELAGMEADHITPWSKGGRSVAANCQMLCKDCNRRKSNV